MFGCGGDPDFIGQDALPLTPQLLAQLIQADGSFPLGFLDGFEGVLAIDQVLESFQQAVTQRRPRGCPTVADSVSGRNLRLARDRDQPNLYFATHRFRVLLQGHDRG